MLSSDEQFSTARSLATSTSPLHSPPVGPVRPPFRRIASRSGRRASQRGVSSTANTYLQMAAGAARSIMSTALTTWNSMSLFQKVAGSVALLIINILLILMLIYGHLFFAWFEPIAKKWRDLPGGWLILWTLIVITAFPPAIGFSSLVTMCGFVFGFWKGWLIAGAGATFGSMCSFIASRTILSAYVHRLVGEDKRFKALALTLKHDGLGMLTMIRFCPLPYSLSNAALSTIPTLQPLSFTLATLFSTPRLMTHVFIGSRLEDLAKGGDSMDKNTKLINYAFIAGGAILGAVLGYVIYRKTTARAQQLEEEERMLAAGEDGLGMADPDDYDDGDGYGMDDDDLSLWNNDGVLEEDYRDSPDTEGDEAGKRVGNDIVNPKKLAR